MCVRAGLASHAWSYFTDQYSPPPSQIAPSPLMLHNLSSQPVFDEMSQQQFIREPRWKTSGNDLY